MILPPELYTRERQEYDLKDLKMYYFLIMDLNLGENINIKRSFFWLKKLVGTERFLEEVTFLRDFIYACRANRHAIDSNFKNILEKMECFKTQTGKKIVGN
ncbi:hypothetical protein CWI38_0023p0070 [Hamiltosporidium tvaerminnensis]|uniref:Uncharacterized protein n=2 Tax=Hamiltosporidium TaxID=1176354 RepID=A0A4Q9LA56_9MICR|nr:hypothetical protein LUQ84_001771 [Hamiltosporidium tvaerminnensis]TBU01944.1 hypothetical protein CWI37_0592p0010 [Hamiltosporidium tvaerminnensis]TBU04185.1 hypothetical protein CWI39_0844p0020 [Hamiltosporidium magnivora]TBU04745.1 hypothetical protein CWI36_0719p0020 [Hamiltosporidium magnivora]TBU20773.1 hypothetical protein CWI38_0023p0070 [Hamiltosporidium tvaerminnensis]